MKKMEHILEKLLISDKLKDGISGFYFLNSLEDTPFGMKLVLRYIWFACKYNKKN